MQPDMTDKHIQESLAEYNVADATIAELAERYLPLKANGADDKDAYAAVRTARLEVKGLRVQIEKKRKELNEDALRHQRAVNGEAKRLAGMIEPIETHLVAEEKAVLEEIEERKKEAARLERERIQARVDTLMELGSPGFNPLEIAQLSDDDWSERLELEKQAAADRAEDAAREAELEERERSQREAASKARREAEQAELAAAKERAEKERAEFEKERAAMAKERKAFAIEQERLEKEREAAEAAAQKAIDERHKIEDAEREVAQSAERRRRQDEIKEQEKREADARKAAQLRSTLERDGDAIMRLVACMQKHRLVSVSLESLGRLVEHLSEGRDGFTRQTAWILAEAEQQADAAEEVEA